MAALISLASKPSLLFASFKHFLSLMRGQEVVGVGLLGTTDGGGKPNLRMLPHSCYSLVTRIPPATQI